MKNQLTLDKLNSHAKPETLTEHRSKLLIESIEFANDVHNGARSADMALRCINGRRSQYHDYYDSLARQAHSIKQSDLAATFRETSKLFSPWKANEFAEDRHTFDKLVAEVEMLEMGNISADVLFYSFGDLTEGDAE